MAHSPRQEGANPAPGSRHKKKFEGVAASAGWRGRRARAWAAEERRHRVAGQQPSLHDAKVVAQFRSTIWRRAMTITMVQIQLRDCDCAIAMPGMAHRAVPGIDRNGCCHRRATGPPATFERRAAHEA